MEVSLGCNSHLENRPLGQTLKNREDVEDFVHGLGFLATGGGGPIEDGLELLAEELAAGREVSWIGIDELSPDAWTVSVSRMGGPPPVEDGPTREELSLYGLREPDVHGNEGGKARVNRQVVAVGALSDFAGVQISGIIPIEVGGGNTAGPMVTGMRLGIPTIDGDYAGRAIPELGNMKVEILGKSCAPLAFVDRWDNVVIASRVVTGAMADRIGRMLGVASFGRLGMAGYLMPAREARTAMVPGTLSLALKLGQAIRRGGVRGHAVEELVAEAEGWLIFRGQVTRVERESKGAFQHFYATVLLNGTDEFQHQNLKIWLKNEAHIAWLDGDPLVTSPDRISIVDATTAVPVTNMRISAGQHLAVIGMKPLDPIYRTPEALSAFSARHFGWDIDYIPIEDKMRSRVG